MFNFTPLAKQLAFGFAVLGLIALTLFFVYKIQRDAKQSGKDSTVVVVQKKVIEDVEKANQARQDNAARSVEQRNADCVRRSRTPENC